MRVARRSNGLVVAMSSPVSEDMGGPYVCIDCGNTFEELDESVLDGREITPCCGYELYEQL